MDKAQSEGLSRWELSDSWLHSNFILTSWINILCTNFSLSNSYKHSPSTAVPPQIQAWLSLSRQDRRFGLCRSLVLIPFSSRSTCSSAAAGEPSAGSRTRVLNSDASDPIKSTTLLHYSQNSWALTPGNWILLQGPKRPAPYLWDFKIQSESNNFLGCQGSLKAVTQKWK